MQVPALTHLSVPLEKEPETNPLQFSVSSAATPRVIPSTNQARCAIVDPQFLRLDWVMFTFTTYRREMKGIDCGDLYGKFKDRMFDTKNWSEKYKL